MAPLGEKGIVGRGILIDMARHRSKEVLDAGEAFNHEVLMAAARAQGVTINKRDILIFALDGSTRFTSVTLRRFTKILLSLA